MSALTHSAIVELNCQIGLGHIGEGGHKFIEIIIGQTPVEGEAHGASIRVQFILEAAERIGSAAGIVRGAVVNVL